MLKYRNKGNDEDGKVFSKGIQRAGGSCKPDSNKNQKAHHFRAGARKQHRGYGGAMSNYAPHKSNHISYLINAMWQDSHPSFASRRYP
ncbi:MAG: hypothetical protein FWG88_08075 [Oscillospiraceae bacterium]|nr:hypothetical protein [Oscillospiraceae bacterium]